MNPTALRLALRKQELVTRSTELREALARDAAGLAPVVSGVDLAAGVLRWLRRHRSQTLGALAVAVLLRPRRLVRWASRGLAAWGMCRRVLAALHPAFALWRQRRE